MDEPMPSVDDPTDAADPPAEPEPEELVDRSPDGDGDGVGDHEADDGEPTNGSSAGSGAPARGMLVERAAAMGVQPGPPPRRTGIFVDVEDLRAHVGGLLRSMLGGYEVDALGNMTFAVEGARIFVTVGPGPMGPHVGVFSILTVDQPLTPDLAAFLVSTNHRLSFGAFSYEPDQKAVWIRHSLLGATLDGPELRTAVINVAGIAERALPILRERFGGGPFTEATEERQRSVHPPEPAHDDDDPVSAGGYL